MPTRRQIMQGMSGLAVTPMFFRSMAAEAATSNDTILVAILLQGGNDGLNTVVPLPQYGTYAALRTPASPPQGLALAYAPADLAPLAFDSSPPVPASQATQFAFAPAMGAMRNLYATGHLAVIAGVGLPPGECNPLSHSAATADWLTGQINVTGATPPGWLGLALDGTQAGKLGPTASLGGTSPLIVGATSQGLVMSPPIDYFGICYGPTTNYAGLVRGFRHLLALPAVSSAGAYDQAVMQGAASAISSVQSIAQTVPAADYPAPSVSLDYQMRDIARMILGGAGVRGYAALHIGYDTHASQAATQPVLLAQLSNAMSNFYTYLHSKGASSNVVVMTISDFGRRPAANLDFGTDHGGGTVSFVLGDRVTGGVFGAYPSLTALDVNQNLSMQVDFRNVISDLVQSMGGNPAAILGSTYPRLGFI